MMSPTSPCPLKVPLVSLAHLLLSLSLLDSSVSLPLLLPVSLSHHTQHHFPHTHVRAGSLSWATGISLTCIHVSPHLSLRYIHFSSFPTYVIAYVSHFLLPSCTRSHTTMSIHLLFFTCLPQTSPAPVLPSLISSANNRYSFLDQNCLPQSRSAFPIFSQDSVIALASPSCPQKKHLVLATLWHLAPNAGSLCVLLLFLISLQPLSFRGFFKHC